MSEIEYALSYLPMFYDDLESHVICITDVLCNREAANELLDSNETHKWKTTKIIGGPCTFKRN